MSATRDHSDVLIVLPAYNEQDSLSLVVAEVRDAMPGVSIVVVDDGSVDDTAAIARGAGARVVELPFNVGVGGALRAGLLIGQREHMRAVVQCDADGQHPARSIPDLVAGLEDADIVIGARFAGEGDYRVKGARSWAMLLLAWVMSHLHHATLTDVTSGFRAFSPRAVEVLGRELPREYLGDTVEALVIAKEFGLRVAQVPVAMRPRQGGVPSQRAFRSTLYLLRVVLILGLALLRFAGARMRQRES